jgi:hypothetical protein
MRLDPRHQPRPGYSRLHLGEKLLAPRALLLRGKGQRGERGLLIEDAFLEVAASLSDQTEKAEVLQTFLSHSSPLGTPSKFVTFRPNYGQQRNYRKARQPMPVLSPPKQWKVLKIQPIRQAGPPHGKRTTHGVGGALTEKPILQPLLRQPIKIFALRITRHQELEPQYHKIEMARQLVVSSDLMNDIGSVGKDHTRAGIRGPQKKIRILGALNSLSEAL